MNVHHGGDTPPTPNLDPTADTLAGAPCGRRRLWVAVVASCPHCGGLHTHRLADADRLVYGLATRSCPTTGREYRLTLASTSGRRVVAYGGTA